MNIASAVIAFAMLLSSISIGVQDAAPPTKTIDTVATRPYPLDRSYADELHELVFSSQPRVKPFPRAEPAEAWTSFLSVCAHVNGAAEIGLAESPALQAWSRTLHPGDRPSDIREDLADAFAGRWDISPVLDEVRATIGRFNASRIARSFALLRDPEMYLPPLPRHRPLVEHMDLAWKPPVRAAVRFNVVRAFLAVRDGDVDGVETAFRDAFAIAEVVEQHPRAASRLLASAIRDLHYTVLEHAAVRGLLSREMCERLREVFDQAPADRWTYAARAERLLALDHADQSHQVLALNARWRFIHAQSLDELWESVRSRATIARRIPQLREVDRFFDLVERIADDDPVVASRAARQVAEHAGRLQKHRERWPFASTAVGDRWPRFINAELHERSSFVGMRTLIAIEHYRHDHGTPPESLDQLVPSYLRLVPMDGFTFGRKPLGYRRIDPAIDPLTRSYLLYSIGADQTDNDGAEDRTDRIRARTGEGPGLDVVFNSVTTWPTQEKP